MFSCVWNSVQMQNPMVECESYKGGGKKYFENFAKKLGFLFAICFNFTTPPFSIIVFCDCKICKNQ